MIKHARAPCPFYGIEMTRGSCYVHKDKRKLPNINSIISQMVFELQTRITFKLSKNALYY